MRRSMTPVRLVSLFLVVLVAGLGMWIWLVNRENNRLTSINRELTQRIEADQTVLFFARTTPANLYLKPVLSKVKPTGDKHLRALEALLAGPPKNSGLLSLFPKGTRILGININNGIATINLNSPATQLNLGSPGEAMAVASIVNTLTKFPDVFRVKILVEGKEVESLAGHVDLTGLLQYNDQVVDPELFKLK